MEFLYFYLMPETPSLPRAGDEGNLLHRSSSELGRAFVSTRPTSRSGGADPFGGDGGFLDGDTLSCERKQDMLGQHLSNVADLVKDLEQYTPGVVGK